MENVYLWAPYLIGAVPVILVAGWSLRRLRHRHESPDEPRKGRLFSTEDDAINVRSADNVRLLSEEQLDANKPTRD